MKHYLSKALILSGLLTSLVTISGCGVMKEKKLVDYDPTNFLPNGHGNPGDADYRPYQIVRDPITISVFAPHGTGNPEYSTLKMFRYLTYLTNIDFDFQTPEVEQYATARAAIWQSGNYPDLFLFSNDISEQVQYMEEGFPAYQPLNKDDLVDINGLEVGNVIDSYMPIYKSLLDKNFDIDIKKENGKDIATLTNGLMYATLNVNDVTRDNTYKIWINNTWIKNVFNKETNSYCKTHNISDATNISSIDDLVGVLGDFKNYDANNNKNPEDEVPLSGVDLDYLRDFILSSYGYCDHTIELEDDESKFTFVPTTDAFRQYLITMNKLWADEVLDHSVFGHTSLSLGSLGQKGQLGCFFSAAPYIVTGTTKQDKYNNYQYFYDEYSAVQPLVSNMNSVRRHQSFGQMVADGACICAKTQYTREIARLLDIMYSELGTQLIAFGLENEDWHWETSEKLKWIKDVPSDWIYTEEEYRATLTPNTVTGDSLYWANSFVGKTKDPITEKLNEQSNIYKQYLKTPVPKKYKFTAKEYKDITTCFGTFANTYRTAELAMISGTKNPNKDSDWEAFKNEMYGSCMSGDLHADEIYNNMLKRYKEAK